MASTPVLRVEKLTKRYRHVRAVEELNFEIHPGEFVGFIGPNGAGKSTTMRCIAGQLLPDAGKVEIQGVNVAADPVAARRHLGYVPQDLDQYGYLTGEELLRFAADVYAVPPDQQDARVAELLALTDLSKARDRLVREYSGGMARKLAVAAALIGRPALLLLDESFVGLDPESTVALRDHLALCCAQGSAVLLSSHILDMLERACSRVLLLSGGTLKLDLDRPALQAKLTGDTPTLQDLYMKTVYPSKAPQASP